MRAARIALVAAGVAAMAYAVVGALTSADIKLSRHALFLVGSLLLFDVALAPLFIAIGFAVRRLVPTPYRAVVQGALVVTATVDSVGP